MKKYTYCFIRYIYDKVKGEFINVGIALHTPEERYLGCRFIESSGFVKRLFNGMVDEHKLNSTLKNIENMIDEKAESIEKELEFEKTDVIGILKSLFPKENGAIEISEAMGGLVDDSDKRLKELFLAYVDRSKMRKERVNTTDRDLYGQLTVAARNNKLKIHRKILGTKNFSHEFKAIQNGRLHAFGAASFDCDSKEEIEKKALLYRGIFDWLKTIDTEDLLFHVVMASPVNNELKKTADEARKLIENSQVTPSIINERELESFVKKLAEDHKN